MNYAAYINKVRFLEQAQRSSAFPFASFPVQTSLYG